MTRISRSDNHSVRGLLAGLLALVLAAPVVLLSPAAPAAADGTPDISLTKEMPAQVLYGEPVPVTLTATNTTTDDGFNASFRDVLPAGASIQSSNPAPDLVLPQPDGTTVVVWRNVFDMFAGVTESLTYQLALDPEVYGLGSTVTNDAEAFVHTDPRLVPRFTGPAATPVETSYTGFGSASATSQLVPFLITKAEPSPENELLRGVHDSQTVYTLTVQNNPTLPSSGFSIVDYLPAGLEFLGCGAVDNSAEETEEYPGSGRISDVAPPALASCPTPSSVTTVETDPDGDGPLPFGVYTRVEWDSASLVDELGSAALAPGSSLQIQYVAAVPLLANELSSDPLPTANLDNNTGPLTFDEQALRNLAVVSGTTAGQQYSVEDVLTVTAEDIALVKTVDEDEISQGALSVWTLLIRSSEYVTGTGTLTVTDRLPDGLDFVSADPAPVSVSEQSDGTVLLTWELAGFTAPSSELVITVNTSTRTTYRGTGGPVSANDSWVNSTDVETVGTVIVDGEGTTAELELTDSSSAEQEGGGLGIDKQVSNPVPDPELLECGAEATTFSADVADGPYRPGDRVCWLVTVNFPAGLDTLQPVLRDFLPNGVELETGWGVEGEGWAPGPENTVDPADIDFIDTSPLLRWDLGDVDAAGQRFQAIIATRITGPDALADGDLLANLAKLTYRNSAGNVYQLRDRADAPYIEPTLALSKGADPTTVVGGEIVIYSITLTNAGSIAADETSVRDLLPDGIVCEDVADLGGAVCDVVDGRSYLQWDDLVVPAAGEVTLTYEVLFPGTVEAGSVAVNHAGVRSYSNLTNNTDSPFVLIPTDNIDPELADQANTGPARDTAQVQIPPATLDKTVTTSVTEPGNGAANQATIGETLSYTLTATVPAGTQVTNAVLTDRLPASMLLAEDTPVLTLNGEAAPMFTTTVVGNQIEVGFPSPYQNPVDSGDDVLVLTYDAVVRDIPGTVRNGGPLINDATLVWAGGLRSDSTIVAIVEPNLRLNKTSNDADGAVLPGQPVTYSLAVSNAGGVNVSPAHDIVVVDQVPDDVIPLDAAGDPVADGGTVPGGGLWSEATRQLRWTIAVIDPGMNVVLAYPTRIANPLTTDAALTNTAIATATSLAGDVDGERGPEAGIPGYQAASSETLTGPTLTTAKSADPVSATIGQQVRYTLQTNIPADIEAFDVTVLDTLPAGVAFEQLVSVTSSGGLPDLTASALAELDDTGLIGFFIGDVTASDEARTVTIVYDVYIDGEVREDAAGDSDRVANSARTAYNTQDRVDGTPTEIPESFDAETPPATATVEIDEPALVLDKSVAGQVGDADWRRAIPGEELTYTITVTNNGTWPAHDIEIADLITAVWGPITEIAHTPADGVTPIDLDPSDGNLAWTVSGPLAPGASVAIVYSLVIPADLDHTDGNPTGPELANTAYVDRYWGVDADERAERPDALYLEYTDVVPDTVEIELDLASIGDLIWHDLNGDGIVDPGEPVLAGVPVRVTYLGPDGVPGGGDDEVHETVTDEFGAWRVDHLPGGQYLVLVDQSASAIADAGLVPSYDLDDGIEDPDGRWLGTLGEAEEKLDVDFGFRGSGAIGDTIWVDVNLDGEQGPGESGIPGVTVLVEWGGPDGDLSTTEDNVTYTAVTDASGNYLVTDLPAGPYRVTVDTDTLSGSYINVYDPDGPAPEGDSTAVLTLGPGETDLDQDFGYAGRGAIGDRIFLDRDDEPGLAGVEVRLTFTGANEETVTLTTITDADGLYLFENLPAGDYVVTVIGGLPANVTNTVDPDGPEGAGDSTSALSLEDGERNLDQDFGYSATSVLGDLVWWDLNGDGVQDPGEPGLPGVTVTITGPNDLTLSTTTDADGYYLFADIPDGTYTVTVSDLPPGFTPTYDYDSGTTDPDGVSVVELETGDLFQDFGFTGASSIGDLVWFDRDLDTLRGTDEPGLAGVTVRLVYAGADGDLSTEEDNLVLETVTGADGSYWFVGLPEGTYRVEIVTDTLPPGLTPTYDLDGGADSVATVELPADTALDTVDFGYAGSASIGDLIWLDLDGDGSQGPGEPGLGGIEVQVIWAGPDGILGTADDVTFTTVTGADGGYLVENLAAGPHRVVVTTATLPPGLVNTYDEDGDLDSETVVALETGQAHLSADFGYRGDGVIGDTVYLDLDGDGSQGPDEPGIPGQRVDLIWAGPDGVLGTDDDETFTTVTDAWGGYDFTGLPDGDYTVTVVGGIADAAVNTGDPDGGGDSTATVTLDEANGRENLDQDFGYQGRNALGDTVWWDLDGDGVQGTDEPGLPGVLLQVVWFGPDGTPGGGDDVALPIAVTGADGLYLVSGLPDGTFSVTVIGGVLPGLAASYDADSGTDAPDGSSVVELIGGADGVTDLDQDFGYVGTGTIGDTVWLDLDGDGVRDGGEPGILGATVTLTWAGADGDLTTTEDNLVWETVVAADGSYLFERLPAGEFRVEISGLPGGLTPTADPDGGADSVALLTLAPGETDLDQDFGYVGDAGVGDTIWLDVDRDGAQSGNEPGLPGLVVIVTHAGADGVLGTDDDLVIETVTDADGRYEVRGLPPGPVRVAYDASGLGAGLVPGSDLDGGNLTVAEVVLGAGEFRDDVDFGVIGTASLNGLVWNDADRDGVRDGGEAGIGGVTVIVTWEGPNGPVEIRVVTGPDGTWSLTDLPPGEYSVRIDQSTVPDGLTATTTDLVRVTLEPGATGYVEHGFGPSPADGGLPMPPTGVMVGAGLILALVLVLAGTALVSRRRSQEA